MMGDDTGFEFEDSENFKSGDDKLTIKTIILRQVHKCMLEGSKEMTQGGVIKKIVDNKLVEQNIPNQREVFINSVEMLKIPLLRKFNKYCKKKDETDIKILFEATEDELKQLKKYYKDTKTKLMTDRRKTDSITQVNSRLGDLYNNFELRKVDIYKKFLISCSYLLDEENYFEEESATGGI